VSALTKTTAMFSFRNGMHIAHAVTLMESWTRFTAALAFKSHSLASSASPT